MDVIVNILDLTNVISATNAFGNTLILLTDTDHAYQEYNISTGLSTVLADFAVDTDAYRMANAIFSQSPRPSRLAIAGDDVSGEGDIPAAIKAFLDSTSQDNPDFFRIVLDEATLEPYQNAVSEWADTNDRMAFLRRNDSTYTQDYTTRTNTAVFVNSIDDQFVDSGAAGYGSARTPGSFTYKFKRLNSILSEAETQVTKDAILAKNANYFATVSGFGEIHNGNTTDGKFIDGREGELYFKALIIEDLSNLFRNTEKIGFDDVGIKEIAGALDTSANRAAAADIIAREISGSPMYEIAYPRFSEVSIEDRNARRLTGVSISYVPQGAIHMITINLNIVNEL